jgi:hypothetical protein
MSPAAILQKRAKVVSPPLALTLQGYAIRAPTPIWARDPVLSNRLLRQALTSMSCVHQARGRDPVGLRTAVAGYAAARFEVFDSCAGS